VAYEAAGSDNGGRRMKAKREGSQTFRYFAATACQGERERKSPVGAAGAQKQF
jgi:hypothetical protein